MTQPNTVTFTPTPEDMLAAFRAATRRRWWRLLLCGPLFGACFGLAGYLGTKPGYDVPAALFGAVFFPVGFIWLQSRGLRRTVMQAYLADPALAAERTVHWDEAGVTGLPGDAGALTPWTALVRVTWTGHSVVLWRDRRRFEFLPLRALTPANAATLTPLLARIGRGDCV